MNALTIVLLGLAGGLGAGTRFVVDGLVRSRLRTALPVGTIAINVTGTGPCDPYLWITEAEEDPDRFLACVYEPGPDGEEPEDPFLVAECGAAVDRGHPVEQ